MGRRRSTGEQRPPRRRGGPDDVGRDIAELSALNTKTLTQRWQSLCGAGPPPGVSRALLVRVLAYRIQERAFGGLKPATRRFLNQFSEDANTRRPPPAPPSRAATAGTVLVREWHGTSHRVTVLDHTIGVMGSPSFRRLAIQEVLESNSEVHIGPQS